MLNFGKILTFGNGKLEADVGGNVTGYSPVAQYSFSLNPAETVRDSDWRIFVAARAFVMDVSLHGNVHDFIFPRGGSPWDTVAGRSVWYAPTLGVSGPASADGRSRVYIEGDLYFDDTMPATMPLFRIWSLALGARVIF